MLNAYSKRSKISFHLIVITLCTHTIIVMMQYGLVGARWNRRSGNRIQDVHKLPNNLVYYSQKKKIYEYPVHCLSGYLIAASNVDFRMSAYVHNITCLEYQINLIRYLEQIQFSVEFDGWSNGWSLQLPFGCIPNRGVLLDSGQPDWSWHTIINRILNRTIHFPNCLFIQSPKICWYTRKFSRNRWYRIFHIVLV